jgi:RNA polymerase sigma-70 factor (ECF subfamily)
MNEDGILVILLKKGDRNAFNTLFEKYSPKLYFFILKTFQNKVEAEEIVQDTFLRLWETRHRIDEKRHFNTYLISIAKHLIYDHLRHKMVERKYNQRVQKTSDQSYTVEDELASESLRAYIVANIERLPPQQKEILLLKSKGYENDEIAQQLNLSKRTVETHINRAFKFLRNSLAHGKELFFANIYIYIYIYIN